jgi:protein disulfide isomerase family A protein 3
MAPEFEKAAEMTPESEVRYIKVDCDGDGKRTCERYDVKGMPTVRLFKNGDASKEFSGGRQADDFVNWLNIQSKPVSAMVDDPKVFSNIVETSTENSIFGFFDDENSAGYKVFNKVADELRESYKFFHSFDKVVNAAAKSLGQDNLVFMSDKKDSKKKSPALKEFESMMLFRPKILASKFEHQIVTLVGKASADAFKQFLHTTVPGIVPIIHPKAPRFKEAHGFPQVLCLYNIDYEFDLKGSQYWRNRIMKVVTDFKEREKKETTEISSGPQKKAKYVNFGVANLPAWKNFVEHHGLMDLQKEFQDSKKFSEKTPICIAFDDNATKYPMLDKFTVQNFENFLDNWSTGKLEPHMKTQMISYEDNISKNGLRFKPNVNLTRKNFDQYINNKEKRSMFIKFYAPWCYHCQKLQKKWDHVAEEFAYDDSIIVASFDLDANDLPAGFTVQSMPKIMWVPKGKWKNAELYLDPRYKIEMIKFLEKNGHKAYPKPKNEPEDEIIRDEL